jgi:transketolase
MRAQFVATTSDLMERDDKIVLLLGDIGVHAFQTAFLLWPKRCINFGCCEQTMVGAAAGFAKEGFYPIVHSIAPFIVRRAYEQIYLDFGVQRLAGAFVTVGAGGGYVALGPTHACPEDYTLMRHCVPNMAVWCPDSKKETDLALRSAVSGRALAYIRL